MLTQPPTLSSDTRPQRSWYLVAGVIALVVTTILSGFFQWRSSNLSNRITALEQQKISAAQQQTETQNRKDGAAKVKEHLRNLETSGLSWSRAIEKIESTVPKLKDSTRGIVNVRSYNGSEDGKVIVSITTRPEAFDPFADIALVISAFSQEGSFIHSFVPSISKNLTPEGAIVLSFSMNLQYQQPTF